MTAVPQAALQDGPLGIICGAGTVPFAVAEAALRRGRRVMLFALRGWADAQAVAAYPHHWIAVGQVGRFCKLARAEGCRDVVLVGGLVRPAISQLRLDWGTLAHTSRIIRSLHGGDDHLLTGVGRIFELEGFRLIGAHEVAPDIAAPLGALGRHRPDGDAERDIELGFSLLAATSPFDIGQAVIVARARVLAVEAAEGTDAMLERIGALREVGRIGLPHGVGVLVKAPKRHQDRRYDLPSIGPNTVAKAARAGLGGIAVVAGATIMAEPQRLVDLADRSGVFVFGRPDREAGP
jgi:DUF1009 family protein